MPSYGIYNKLLRPVGTREDVNDSDHDRMVDERILDLGVHPVGTRLEEVLKTGNQWTLGDGVYPPFDLSAPHGIISAASPGAKFEQRCVMRDHTTVFGVTFTDTADPLLPEMVRIGSDTSARFVGCTFVRSAGKPFSHVYVEDASGILSSVAGTAVFIGCTFINGGSTTVDNAGAAGRVQMIGCVNMTGNVSLGTVTETGTIGI
tara:strand:- start:3538 stop:4149 length:612 start_codon:yes stop_codon:yes gene_type:complete